MEENRRRKNEEKFGSWQDLPGGGRVYFYEVQGHHGWTARYLKEVDALSLRSVFGKRFMTILAI